MNKIELIKKEIERLYKENKERLSIEGIAAAVQLSKVLNFINSLSEEPVSNPIDFEQELYKDFGQVKDFTLGMQIVRRFYNMGRNSQESVSEDLNEAAKNVGQKYFPDEDNIWARPNYEAAKVECAFKDGAKWQKEQFEKNRIAACDRQTKEEAERESDFCLGIIENEHRQPTYSDAIEYGMRLKEQQIIKKAVEWLYEQLNYGRMECGNIEEFINDFRKAMSDNN